MHNVGKDLHPLKQWEAEDWHSSLGLPGPITLELYVTLGKLFNLQISNFCIFVKAASTTGLCED